MERSGNVTIDELEDIIKLYNPDLKKYDIKEPLRDFTYEHNALLVDYKKFL